MSEKADLFLVASRKKLRFPVPSGQTPQGQLTVEDLWQLPLVSTGTRVSLESIAGELQTKLAALPTSILRKGTRSPEREKLELSLEIVMRIADILQEEADSKTRATATESRRAELMALLREKQRDSMTVADIERELATLTTP